MDLRQECGKKSRHGVLSRRATPEDRRILQLALTNKRMEAAEIRTELTDYWKLGWNLELPCVVYRLHHTTDNRDLHGVEPESTGALSGILWWSETSFASVVTVRLTPTCPYMTWWKVTGRRLSRRIPLQHLESWWGERIWHLLKGDNVREYVARMVNPVVIPFMTRVHKWYIPAV